MCFDSTLVSSQFENIKVPVPSLGCSSSSTKDVVDNKPPIDNQSEVLPEEQKKEGTTEESKEVVVEVKEQEKQEKQDSDESLKNDSISVVEPVQETGSNQV